MPDARQYNRLAEEMTPNKDATVWTIRLRKGVTFHNGKDLTAEDVLFTFTGTSIQRRRRGRRRPPRDQGQGDEEGGQPHGLAAVRQALFDLGPESVQEHHRVHTCRSASTPRTGRHRAVQVREFTPGQQSMFVRNPDYWNSPLPYLDTLIMTDYADETSQINALIGGQVDVVNLYRQDVLGSITPLGQQGRHLRRRRLEPVHDARRPGAV